MIAPQPSRRARIMARMKGIPKAIAGLPGAIREVKLPPLAALTAPILLGLAFVLVVAFFVILRYLNQPISNGRQIPYSQVLTLAAEHRVTSATLYTEDSVAVIHTTGGQEEWTSYPKSDALTSELVDALLLRDTTSVTTPQQVPAPPPASSTGAPSGTAQVQPPALAIDAQTTKSFLRFVDQFLLPLLILACVFSFFFLLITGKASGAGDFMGFSKMKAKVKRKRKGAKNPNEGGFHNIAGVPEALIELQEVVDYLTAPARFAAMGARAPKGTLLCGPPGTGKTLLARSVAAEAGVPFISLSGSEFVESLVGVGAARVRDLFRQAREMAPCIIFIDEIDAAGRQRGVGMGQGNDEREQTLNQLMVEMDGFAPSLGIAVMAATNRPDILDAALLRPGRFDRQIVIDVPDVNGRTAILEVHTRNRNLAPDVDLREIAKQTPGFTGAELANIVNEAALLAVRAERNELIHADFEEAVDRVIAGPARKSHLLTPEEKEIIAYHEAGHAVVGRAVGMRTGVIKLSIVARGRQLGHTTTYLTSDRMVMLHSDLERQLVTMFGGLACEQMVYEEVSTGNSQDLHEATELAKKIVATYGMVPELSRMQIVKEGAAYLGRDMATMGMTAPETLTQMDHEIRAVLERAEQRATTVCHRNRALIEEIVHLLMEEETLSGPEIEPYLTQVVPLAELVRGGQEVEA
jgi:cell division protease FtsH